MNNPAASSGVSPDVSFRNSAKAEYPESIYRFPTKDFGNDKTGQVENADLSVPRGIKPIFENKPVMDLALDQPQHWPEPEPQIRHVR